MTSRKIKASQKSEKASWKNWGDHPIAVIIGSISSLIAIGIGIASLVPNRNSSTNSSQASSPDTEIGNPTSTPFFTTIPTPTNILYYDDFSDQSSGWDEVGYSTGWYKILHDTWHEKPFYTWESIGIIDGIFGIRVTSIGLFEDNGHDSRGIIFGSSDGNGLTPYSFAVNKSGICKIFRYSNSSEYGEWHSILEGQVKGFDSKQSFYTLEIQVTNFRQVRGYVDRKLCIDAVIDDYVPGFVGLFATPTYSSADYRSGESYFDDYYVFRP